MISICPYNETFLTHSFLWLNDSTINILTNSSLFTKKEQLKWFSSIKNKKDYMIWGVLHNSTPIGACGLKNITKTNAEYWGYIGEKNFWGKGFGGEIIKLMEKEARNLSLNNIWLQVVTSNKRAINLYKKNGFKQEKEVNNLIYMKKFL